MCVISRNFSHCELDGRRAGLEDHIKQFAESDVLRAILDQGVDPKEYEHQYEAALREAEQGSVQDYIAESENLGLLSAEVHTPLPLPPASRGKLLASEDVGYKHMYIHLQI